MDIERTTHPTPDALRRTYAALMHAYHATAPHDPEDRWAWLMAAHVVGQSDFRLHVDSHRRMVAHACATRDWPEAAGQLFRLALVPIGHAIGRLPAGNVGRATVNAFRPMDVPPDIAALIRAASVAGR